MCVWLFGTIIAVLQHGRWAELRMTSIFIFLWLRLLHKYIIITINIINVIIIVMYCTIPSIINISPSCRILSYISVWQLYCTYLSHVSHINLWGSSQRRDLDQLIKDRHSTPLFLSTPVSYTTTVGPWSTCLGAACTSNSNIQPWRTTFVEPVALDRPPD